jgi:hypothetical protein
VALEEPPEPSGVSLFERLAKDQNVDVDKLERLMQMHERATARLAQEKFNAAMSAAQTEMRPVAVDSDNPQTKSKYASYEAIDRVLRPIYTKHGFGLSFDTGEGAPDQWVRVLCYVTHAGGYARTYHADMPADGKGAKGGDVMTRTHAVGAAMSYGMRYLLKMIFNVAVGDEDTDGNQENDIPDPPDGFQKWWDGLKHSAKQGSVALEAAWTCSADEPYKSFRKYVATYGANQWTALRAEARRVKA